MRRLTLFFVLGLVIINLVGCNSGLIPSKEKRLEDSPGMAYRVDADGTIRGPLPMSLESLILNELEERLGISPDEIENKPPEERERLVRELKVTLSKFSPITISSAHNLLNLYFWPEDESKTISLKQLKKEIAELEKEWNDALAGIEELKDIPAVKAFIGDVSKAFEEVRRSSIINHKSLVTAHNMFHDLESIWGKTDPPPYGVTETEKILRTLTPGRTGTESKHSSG